MGQGIVRDRIQAYIGMLEMAKSMTHAGEIEPRAHRTRLYVFCTYICISAGFSFLRRVLIHAIEVECTVWLEIVSCVISPLWDEF